MSTLPDPNPDELPLLGGLLRLNYQEVANHLEAGLAASGFTDVRPAQFAVFQALAKWREGVRLTELASYAGITKPSMSALVDGLERAGFVQRVPHPTDQRAQLICFTARGWKASRRAFELVREVEARWAERIGKKEVATLRKILRNLVDTRASADAPAGARRAR